MLGEEGGLAEAPVAPVVARRRTDPFVIGAAGLTIAALLAVASQALRAASLVRTPFGDRVLDIALSGPVVWTAFLVLVLAAVALACLAPANESTKRVVDLLRIVVGLLAVVGIVEFGYSAFVFATNAAIGHTQLTGNFGPSARVATTSGSASSLLLSACALWFVARRPESPADLATDVDALDADALDADADADADALDADSDSDEPRAEAPSWSVVGATAMLSALGGLALFELLLEPLLKRPDARIAAAFGGASVSTRLEYAAGSYGLYPITLLAFAVVAMIVAARRRTAAQGVSTLAAGAALGGVGVAAAAYVIYRVFADHTGGGSTANIARASTITGALASAVVGALAATAALWFAQPERRVEVVAPDRALRLPSVAVTRIGAFFATGAAVAVAAEIVAAVVQKQGPSFRDAVVQLGSVMLFGAIVALGAALLARVAGAPGNGLTGVSVTLLVVGIAIVGCEAFAFVNVLWMHHDGTSLLYNLLPLQRHNLAALALACVLVGFAVLSLLVGSGDIDGEEDADIDSDAAVWPEPLEPR